MGFLEESRNFVKTSAAPSAPTPKVTGTGFLQEARDFHVGKLKPAPEPVHEEVETADPGGVGGQSWARDLGSLFSGQNVLQSARDMGGLFSSMYGVAKKAGDIMTKITGEFGRMLETGTRAARATSDVAAAAAVTPLKYLGTPSQKQDWAGTQKELMTSAYDHIVNNKPASADIEKAAQMYQKTLGPWSKMSPLDKASDIAVLTGLGVIDMMGDPIFEAAGVLRLARAVHDWYAFPKVMEAVHGGEVGQRLTPKGTIYEGPINANQKVKITATKEGPVIVEGYQKRGTTGSGIEKPAGPKEIAAPKKVEEPTITRTVPNDPEAVGKAVKEVATETKPSPAPMPVKTAEIQVKPELFQMSRRGELRSGLIDQNGVEPLRVLGYLERGFKPEMVAKDPMKLGRMNFDDPERGIKKGDVVLISGHHRLEMAKKSGLAELPPELYEIKEYDDLGKAVKDSIAANTSDFKLTTYEHNLIDMYRNGLIDHTNLLDTVGGDVKRAEQIARIGNFVKKLPDSVWENALIKLSTAKQADEKLIARKMSALDALAQAAEKFPEVMTDPNLQRKVNIQVSKIVRVSDDTSMKTIEAGVERLSLAKSLEEVKQTDLFGQLKQKEEVKEVTAKGPKTIKEVAQETGILEPNVRRILGVGEKEGTFERLAEGVYVLKTKDGNFAYIQAGDALEVLPELANKGVKVDMAFLDIPYDTPAVKGGNRGVKYALISVDDFKTKVVPAIKKMLKTDDSTVIFMYSNARSGWAKMMKYNEAIVNSGLKIVAKGNYTKVTAAGKQRNYGQHLMMPEGILVFNKSGKPTNLPNPFDYRLVAPLRQYPTEKPMELLKRLIEGTTKPGEVVLDPFAGSGVAPSEAIKAGRSAIAIEKNPEVVETRIKPRVEAAAKHPLVGKRFGTPEPVKKEPARTIPPEEQIQYLSAEVGIPGLREAMIEDVIPGVKNTASNFRKILDEIRHAFYPAHGVDPRQRRTIEQNIGTFEKHLWNLENAGKEIEKFFDTQPPEQNLDFIAKVQEGKLDGIPPGLRDLAEHYRTILDTAHADIGRFKNLNYLENFFPQFWKDPEKADKFFQQLRSKRPFQGSTPFLKKRLFATMQEGIAAGLEPISTNPQTLLNLYTEHVSRFILAQDTMKQFIEEGIAKFIRYGTPAPEGYAKLDDKITKRWLPPTMTMKEAHDFHIMDRLESLARDMGIDMQRVASMRGKTWGTAKNTLPDKTGTPYEIRTRFGGPETVITHEIGHVLDYKYGLADKLVGDPKTKEELRRLADLRYPGHWYYGEKHAGGIPKSFRQYIRKGTEKMANLVHAYIHAPELLEEVAPQSKKALEAIIDAHPELKQLRGIKPSLALGTRVQEISRGGPVLIGEYYLPKDTARILNNYLSRDSLMESATGKGLLWAKNFQNAWNFTMSAFHPILVSGLAQAMELGQGVSAIGDLRWRDGLMHFVKAPLAPIFYMADGMKFFRGDAHAQALESLMFSGGMSLRAKQQTAYKNNIVENFARYAREGKSGRALIRLPGALIDFQQHVIFGSLVPRMKVGAIRHLLADELTRRADDIAKGKITPHEIAREVVHHVDDLMGMLNYDTLFWNRTMKSTLMLTTRALGWNIGLPRWLGLSASDTVKMFKEYGEWWGAGGKKSGTPEPKMPFRMSSLMGVILTTVTAGALYQYLHTGKRPESVNDLLHPRDGGTDKNGNPTRANLKNYMSDLFDYLHHPILTIEHKESGLFAAVTEMLQNKDYYGDYIVNTRDNLPTRLKQEMHFLIQQMQPFSVQTYGKLKADRDVHWERVMEGFLGIGRAPKQYIESDKEAAIYRDLPSRGPRTPEEVEISRRKTAARDAIRRGDYSLLDKLIKDGIIQPKSRRRFIKDAQLTPAQRAFKLLPKKTKADLTKQYGK